jgi:hypothetical protein
LTSIWQTLVRSAGQLFHDLDRRRPREEPRPAAARSQSSWGADYEPLKRVTLTDEVARTLFEEYETHRRGPRGHEETGWVILGLREVNEAIVLATLPAGTESSAGVAHVRFNSVGQALASRIVRQQDRRLTMLGVVHTHPGSLRHPSDGDFRGDSQWVERLRGGEGIFGIGTADARPSSHTLYARQPKPHVQCLGPLCLSWYSLKKGDTGYQPLPYGLTIGPDMARPLHSIWTTIEAHAERLDRLSCQQAGVQFELTAGREGPALEVTVPLAESGDGVRALLEGDDVRYYLLRQGELLSPDLVEARVDRGVYLLLAEVAAQV